MVYVLDKPECLHAHISYLMNLINLRREINIKVKLLNFLICVMFSMIWSSLTYSNCASYLTVILGLLTMVTLAWIAVAQSNHIEQLGKSITALCVNSPFNDPDQSDRLSENGQHWNQVCVWKASLILNQLSHF